MSYSSFFDDFSGGEGLTKKRPLDAGALLVAKLLTFQRKQ